MKKVNYKEYYVIIGVKDFEVRVSSFKVVVSKIVGCSRNTVSKIKDRMCINGYIVVRVIEE